jgi:zinc protease
LLDSLTNKKFENQRDAVKNEKSQNWDNRPYARVSEVTNAALYPAGHPYSWPVIGYVNDLNSAKLEDVRRFFLRWYGPNNACIVLAGDVNTEEALKLIDKYFGNLKKGPEVKKMKVESVVLPEDRYTNMEDNVYLPLIVMTFPTVPAYHPDEAPLDFLKDLIGSGKNSILYKKFDDAEIGQSYAGSGTYELSGNFEVGVLPYPDGSADDSKIYGEFEAKLRQALDEFEKTGFTDADLERLKGAQEFGYARTNESCFGKANLLARWWAGSDNKYNVQSERARYQNVTKADVMRVYNKYIKGKKCLITLVHPINPETGKKKIQTAENPLVGNGNDGYGELKYVRPTDNFDRFKRPEVGPYKNAVVPTFKKYDFDNGIQAIGTKTSESPTISFSITMKGGAQLDPAKKLGLAALTAAMMNEGTQKYTAEQFEAELDRLGSSITFYGSSNATTIGVSCLAKNIDATLALLDEALNHPRFDEKSLRRLKKEVRQNFKGEFRNGSLIASKVFQRLIYKDSPLGNYYLGDEGTISAISMADIKDFYAKYYSPSHASIVFAGDIGENELVAKIGFLKSWPAKPYTLPTIADVKKPEKTTVYFVNMVDATDANIVMGYPAMPFDYNGEYFKANLMNFSFSGGFLGRLNIDLREDKGYTYGIYGGFSGNKNTGSFAISASLRGTACDTALTEIMSVMKTYIAGGVTDEELAFAKKSYTSSDGLRYETSGQKAGFLRSLQEYGLPTNYTDEQNALVKKFTKEEMNEYAKKYLLPDNMVIVIVTDKKLSKKNIEKRGFKVVEVDKNGN